MSSGNQKKDQVFVFSKKSLAEPLNDYSKYILHMVEANEEPGKFICS